MSKEFSNNIPQNYKVVRRKHALLPKYIHDGRHKFETSYLHQGRSRGSMSGDNVGNTHLNTYHTMCG